jgi:isoquinoline 1-oxidoreductase beta subunit
MSAHASQVTRRQFVVTTVTAAAGLTIGCRIGDRNRLGGAAADAAASFTPNAFIRIAPDDTVTVIAKHLEMGQGVHTGLATIVAEELDADWGQMRVEGAPADAKRYNNLLMGPFQGTGGSTAIANSFDQLRAAGATARAMLVAAAAEQWKVPAGELTVDKGKVVHAASGRTAAFGALAERASKLSPPTDAKPKDRKDFVYIGKARLPRKDSADKTTGKAIFTQDIKRPAMLTALVAHPRRFGAKVKSFDASAAKAIPGVVEVVQVPTGVAVLAEGFWPAKRGRDVLKVEWDESGANMLGSEEILAKYRELAKRPGLPARADGDAKRALASAARTVEATYEFPFLAHAAMEPMNCVVELGRDRCEIWNGEQLQTADQQAIAAATGLKPEQVTLNMLYAGGSFGRRANPKSDYLLEAVEIAKAIEGRAPVKLVWTREDDMQAGYFRPMYLHVLRGGVDAQGRLVAWQQRIVGQSILKGTLFEGFMVKDGIDATSVEGASTLPYRIPNVAVDLHTTSIGVPVQWWRSVGHTHTGYATEAFMDELAAAARRDPYEFRRELLADHPRHRAVLDLAAEKAGWGKPLPEGRGRGIAVHESFSSFVAQVAEVSVAKDGAVRVHRVVCAVDCGTAVNPDVIRAQMEGGIGYGLGAALYGEVTLKGGVVQQTNFQQYRPLRISEMPAVEVHIVESDAPPTGVGEPGVPPIAPAVANAVFAATGHRVRKLPIRLGPQATA